MDILVAHPEPEFPHKILYSLTNEHRGLTVPSEAYRNISFSQPLDLLRHFITIASQMQGKAQIVCWGIINGVQISPFGWMIYKNEEIHFCPTLYSTETPPSLHDLTKYIEEAFSLYPDQVQLKNTWFHIQKKKNEELEIFAERASIILSVACFGKDVISNEHLYSLATFKS